MRTAPWLLDDLRTAPEGAAVAGLPEWMGQGVPSGGPPALEESTGGSPGTGNPALAVQTRPRPHSPPAGAESYL